MSLYKWLIYLGLFLPISLIGGGFSHSYSYWHGYPVKVEICYDFDHNLGFFRYSVKIEFNFDYNLFLLLISIVNFCFYIESKYCFYFAIYKHVIRSI